MEPWLTTSAAVARRASSQAAARAAGMLAGSAPSSAARHPASCPSSGPGPISRRTARPGRAPATRSSAGRVPVAPLGQGQGGGHPPGRNGMAGEAELHGRTGHHGHHVERFRAEGGGERGSRPGIQHGPHDGVVLPAGGHVQRVDIPPAGDPGRSPVEHVPALGRPGAQPGWPRPQAGQGHPGPPLAAAQGPEHRLPQRGIGGLVDRAHHAVVLHPHERRGQARPGQDLDDLAGRRERQVQAARRAGWPARRSPRRRAGPDAPAAPAGWPPPASRPGRAPRRPAPGRGVSSAPFLSWA